MGLGSDTRGSVRILAAPCGVAGQAHAGARRPYGRLPSRTRSTRRAARALRRVLRGLRRHPGGRRAAERGARAHARAARRPTPPRPDCFAMEDLDAHVTAAFARRRRARGGRRPRARPPAPPMDAAHALYAGGGFAGPESARSTARSSRATATSTTPMWQRASRRARARAQPTMCSWASTGRV